MGDKVNVTKLLTNETGRSTATYTAKFADSAEKAVMILIQQRAGMSPVARFLPGELAARSGLTEHEVHEAVDELSKRLVLGADSHPQAVLLLANFPEYQPPSPKPVATPADRRIITIRRRNGKWTSTYVDADSTQLGIGGEQPNEWDDEETNK